MSETIKLSNVTISYPNVFTPKAFGGGEGKKSFDLTGILNKKKDKAQISNLEAKIEAFIKENKLPGAKSFLHDGSEKADQPGYGPDVVFFRAKSDDLHRPQVIGRNKAPLTAADDKIYGGAVCNIWISLWGQAHPKYGKWIGANLLGIQFVEDGARLGGETIDLDAEATNLEDDDDPSK